MRSKFVVLLVVLFLVATTSVFGQTWDQAKGFGLTGSIFKFVGGEVDRAGLGLTGGLSLRYGATPHIMLDLNANYGSFQPTVDGERFKNEANSPYQTFVMPITLSVRYTPAPEARLKPYIYLGGGALLWDLRNVTGTDKSFLSDMEFAWGERVYSTNKRDAIYKAGLGLETFLTNWMTLDLQAGVFGVASANPADNVGYADNNSYAPEARATLAFYFGYFKDSDKDGIEDKKDAAPLLPEDFDNFMDQDGAPDLDNDQDGIPDVKDQAPNVAEDIDGFQDEDGVPDPDNDQDGILDVQDKAPNEKEDVDGFQDADGAPDPDNDGDGIADVNDKCPGSDATVAQNKDTRETMNGFEDTDGCPDQKPAPKPTVGLEKAGAKLILQGVNFETASDKLTPESFAILDGVIVGLKDNKDVQIEVRGYTDNKGADKYNQKLSERRAQAVMKYLVDSGIDSARLKAAGYGKKDPIAPNDTPEGRAKNRRIEFVRMN